MRRANWRDRLSKHNNDVTQLREIGRNLRMRRVAESRRLFGPTL